MGIDNQKHSMALEDLEHRYRDRNGESEHLFEKACSVLPGGDTRSVTYTPPYPTFIDEAAGCRMTTVDGDEVIDFLNNYTQSIHGHTPEAVVEAMTARIRKGNGLGSPTSDVIDLAERLVGRFPSIERVRFGNSGTEATMNAIRAAIAFTGRERILKVEGGYHGTHDSVEVGISGDGREHIGIPESVENRVETVRYNDTEALKSAFEEYGDELACFILEPVLGASGMIPSTNDYLETARDLTEAHDSLLIFDEVITSRLSTGGAQQKRDVHPDLTALGKYIGGGLPVGAFGGREDVMNVFHPDKGDVGHSGTFNGNPATMAGGVVTLDALDAAAIDEINAHGEIIREQVQAAGDAVDIPVTVTGEGSLFHLHFTEGSVTDLNSAGAGLEDSGDEGDNYSLPFYLAMRERDIFMAPRGMGNISTPMTDEEIDAFVEAADASFRDIE